jgi:hypothetical protein
VAFEKALKGSPFSYEIAIFPLKKMTKDKRLIQEA